MPSRLQKARQDPNSMKARILSCARRLFGEFGYNGTTTRMIAKDAGIDSSTLHYHWGDKLDLYEAVILDVGEEVQAKLNEIEAQAGDDRSAPVWKSPSISCAIISSATLKYPTSFFSAISARTGTGWRWTSR